MVQYNTTHSVITFYPWFPGFFSNNSYLGVVFTLVLPWSNTGFLWFWSGRLKKPIDQKKRMLINKLTKRS